jgi:hypothetical protein
MTHFTAQKIKRWLDIILLSSVSFFVIILFEKYFESTLILLTLGKLDLPLLGYIIAIFSSIFCGYLLMEFKIGTFNSEWFKSNLGYPSLLVAIFISSTSIFLYKGDYKVIWYFVFCIGLGVFIVKILKTSFDYLSEKKDLTSDATISGKEKESNEDKYINWILNNDAIKSIDDDKFRMEDLAEKIVEMLITGKAKSILLLGPWGSGKTSVVNLTIENLEKNNKNFIIDKVDVWTTDTSQIQSRILESLVEKCSNYFDCSAFYAIPWEYVRAVQTSGKAWGLFLNVFYLKEVTPLKILETLDSALLANKKKLLLIVEDIDRIASTPKDVVQTLALLDLFKKLENVDIVLTTSLDWAEKEEFPFRIFDSFKLMRPGFSRNELWDAISTFKKVCLNRFSEDFVIDESDGDSVSLADNKTHFFRIAPSMGLNERSNSLSSQKDCKNNDTNPLRIVDATGTSSLEKNECLDYLLEIIKNIRSLKTCFRETFILWNELHGEIEWDDLFVITTIKTLYPKIYLLLFQNYDDILRYARERPSSEHFENPYLEQMKKVLDNKLNKIAEEYNLDNKIIVSLIAFCLPQIEGIMPNGKSVRQGIRYEKYWNRFINGSLSENELRDQEVVNEIQQSLSQTKFETIVKKLYESKDYSELFERFASLFYDGDSIRNLVSQFFSFILEKDGNRSTEKGVAGFIPVWRTTLGMPIDPVDHSKWASNELKKALQISLRFTYDILYYFSSNSHDDVKNPTDIKKEIRQQAISYAKEIYEGDINHFIKVLDPQFPYDIWDMIYICAKREYGGKGLSLADWQWLGNIMFVAAKIKPDMLLPKIAITVTNQNNVVDKTTVEFVKGNAKDLYGEKWEEIRNLLINSEPPDLLDEEDRRIYKETIKQLQYVDI